MVNETTKNKLRESLRIKILILLVTIGLIVWMFPKGESLEFEVTENSIWLQDDLIASIPFEVLKDDSTLSRERREAEEQVLPVFVKNVGLEQIAVDSISRYNKKFINLLNTQIFNPNQQSNTTFLSDNAYFIMFDLYRQENLLSESPRISLKELLNLAEDLVKRVYERNLLDRDAKDIGKDKISLREGKYEKIQDTENFLDPTKLNSFINDFIRSRVTISNKLYDAVYEYIDHFMEPNIVYSQQFTDEAKELARSKVPRSVSIVNENERIVAKHDRITKDIKAKINSYRLARGEDSGLVQRILQNVGKVIHIILIFSLYIIYIYLFRKKIYNDNQKILLIVIVILFISLLAYLVRKINVDSPVELLVLVPVASMLLTVIFDSRVGFYGTIVIALIAGGLRGNDYVFAVTNIAAGALAAYTVRDIKNRTQIFRSFLFILIGYVASIIAFGFERLATPEDMLIRGAFAASNALVSPVLAYGLIIFFEKAFRITTDLTLLELTDFNRPLLKELAKSAPGTFTHSMTIGSMVENAAEAIGANPILARVGAYYHDIGKTLHPDNFVENQMNNENVHESLEPKESVKIIIDHVKKGVELANEHNLPQDIIDFIPMHHGTMVVSYFYEKAKELYGEGKVDINDFRYPGPKPQSAETALLMLADACESAVRSMTDPDSKKVENIIGNLIKMRVEDGQLDDAPITLSDLKKIKQSYINILVGQHHKRIRYPKQNEIEDNNPDAPSK